MYNLLFKDAFIQSKWGKSSMFFFSNLDFLIFLWDKHPILVKNFPSILLHHFLVLHNISLVAFSSLVHLGWTYISLSQVIFNGPRPTGNVSMSKSMPTTFFKSLEKCLYVWDFSALVRTGTLQLVKISLNICILYNSSVVFHVC